MAGPTSAMEIVQDGLRSVIRYPVPRTIGTTDMADKAMGLSSWLGLPMSLSRVVHGIGLSYLRLATLALEARTLGTGGQGRGGVVTHTTPGQGGK